MQDTSLIMLGAAAVIGVISLIIGLVIGVILSGMRSQPAAKPEVPPSGLQLAARLWRSKKNGQVVVEIEQKMFAAPGELDNRKKAILNGLVSELELWVGGEILSNRASPASQPGPAPISTTAANQRLTAPPQPSSAAPIGLQSAQPRPAFPAPQVRIEPVSEVKPPSMEISDILSRALVPNAPKNQPVASKSIAIQIDEVIQRRLPETAYRGRNIHLRDTPGGGITVFVDDNRFSGVDEVRDPGVREFLHACIAEWERIVGSG